MGKVLDKPPRAKRGYSGEDERRKIVTDCTGGTDSVECFRGKG